LNIVLIGMPGAGKSTVGVVLSKLIGYRFVDTDLLIQAETEKLLPDLIDEYGDEGFLEIEEKTLLTLEGDGMIIATGGSAVYSMAGMQHLKSIGKVIHLLLPYGEISMRVGSLHRRGVASPGGKTLKELYDERIPLYEKYADMTIRSEKMSISETAQFIAENIK